MSFNSHSLFSVPTHTETQPPKLAPKLRVCHSLSALLSFTLPLVVFGSSATATNLVADGGFEMPVTGPGGVNSGYTDFATGDTIASVWKVVGSSLGRVAVYPKTETLNGTVTYNVVEGSQALDLTGDVDNGEFIGVEQAVQTSAGSLYSLSFYVGSTLGQPAIVDALVNGTEVLNATNSNESVGATNWQQFSYIFTAAGSSTVLDLYSGSPAGVETVGVDAVTLLQSAPEPATISIAATGLILLSVISRRFVRAA